MVVSDDDTLFNAVFDAWRATLPNGEFEPDRSLADAGVDSLRAMELILRIERTLDCKIPYAMLTAETTPRSLALGLSRGGVRRQASPVFYDGYQRARVAYGAILAGGRRRNAAYAC